MTCKMPVSSVPCDRGTQTRSTLTTLDSLSDSRLLWPDWLSLTGHTLTRELAVLLHFCKWAASCPLDHSRGRLRCAFPKPWTHQLRGNCSTSLSDRTGKWRGSSNYGAVRRPLSTLDQLRVALQCFQLVLQITFCRFKIHIVSF